MPGGTTSVTADDAVYASATMPSPLVPQRQGIYGFSLGAVQGAVKGIVVEVQGYVTSGGAPVAITAYLGRRTANGNITNSVGPFNNYRTGSPLPSLSIVFRGQCGLNTL